MISDEPFMEKIKTAMSLDMCIRELESAVKGGMRVFDVGTGSGVLAVAAAKLGAGEVVAMDYDRTAATVAQENVVCRVTQPLRLRNSRLLPPGWSGR